MSLISSQVSSLVGSQSTQACDSSLGLCVAFSIPANSTDQTGEILVSVEAPATRGWVGFGFGQQMAGSLIFVLWLNDDQVVVSSRFATEFPFPQTQMPSRKFAADFCFIEMLTWAVDRTSRPCILVLRSRWFRAISQQARSSFNLR